MGAVGNASKAIEPLHVFRMQQRVEGILLDPATSIRLSVARLGHPASRIGRPSLTRAKTDAARGLRFASVFASGFGLFASTTLNVSRDPSPLPFAQSWFATARTTCTRSACE